MTIWKIFIQICEMNTRYQSHKCDNLPTVTPHQHSDVILTKIQQLILNHQFVHPQQKQSAETSCRSWRSKLWSNRISMSWSGNAESPSSEVTSQPRPHSAPVYLVFSSSVLQHHVTQHECFVHCRSWENHARTECANDQQIRSIVHFFSCQEIF